MTFGSVTNRVGKLQYVAPRLACVRDTDKLQFIKPSLATRFVIGPNFFNLPTPNALIIKILKI